MMRTDKDIEPVIDRLAASTRSPRGEYSMHASRVLLNKRIAAWRRRRFLRVASSVAAVVILGVLSWNAYIYMAPADILTVSTLAETKTVQLPDGTRVMLNRYTSLSYPEKFKKKNREVSLQGEAYFAVSKDKSHPFIVQTGAVDVRVLGTEFNVESYPNDELIKTTLFEGSVALDAEGNTLILVPGESAVYDKTAKNLTKEKGALPNDDIAWKTGGLIFTNQPLKEIVRQLSNTFGVDIRVQDAEIENYKMTARFMNHETLDDIMNLLEDAGNFKVIRENDSTLRILK